MEDKTSSILALLVVLMLIYLSNSGKLRLIRDSLASPAPGTAQPATPSGPPATGEAGQAPRTGSIGAGESGHAIRTIEDLLRGGH